MDGEDNRRNALDMGCISSLIVAFAIHAQIIAFAGVILMLLVVVVQLGIHLREETVQIHAVAVKDILIYLFCMVPAFGDHNGIGV